MTPSEMPPLPKWPADEYTRAYALKYGEMVRAALSHQEAGAVGHLHSNGDFCQDRTISVSSWPIKLYLRASPQEAPSEAERFRKLLASCREAMAMSMAYYGPSQSTDWVDMIAAIDAALQPKGDVSHG